MIKQLAITLLLSPLLALASSEVPSNVNNTASSQATESVPAQQNMERKEREFKEPESEDIAASPEQWEDLKKIISKIVTRNAGIFIVHTVSEESTDAQDIVIGWTHNKIVRRLFDTIDAQAPIEEIAKFFEKYPQCINARDKRRLFSIFQSQQDVLNTVIQVFENINELNESRHRTWSDLNDATEQMTVTSGSGKKYSHEEMQSRVDYQIHGLTPLMRASAQRNENLVELLLGKQADITATSDIAPWMVDDTHQINLINFSARLLRETFDSGSKFMPEGDLSLIKIFKWNDPLVTKFFRKFDALSCAILAGNSNIVEQLVKSLVAKHEPELVAQIIRTALFKLTLCSDLKTADHAYPLFVALGIDEPKRENYLAIAQKLTQAYIAIIPKNGQFHSEQSKIHLFSITKLLFEVMRYGSADLFAAIAREFAHYSLHWEPQTDIHEQAQKFVEWHTCGEKLGILYSIDARDTSIVHHMRRSMLERVEDFAELPGENPLENFIIRLRQFVHEHQIMPGVEAELNMHLPPVLAPIVRAYITLQHAPPPALCERILALPDNPEATSQLRLRHNSQEEKTGPG